MDFITALPVVAKALTKPADTLIKKLATGCGVVYKPYHTVEMAKANAKASFIETQAKLALDRMIHDEAKRMSNEQAIIAKALPLLNETIEEPQIDEDWLQNFVTKSRNTSDEVLQETWARILAGEVNQPNSFSKKVVNLVSELGQRDAELFTLLASFSVSIAGTNQLFIIDVQNEIFSENGLTFAGLQHLAYLGLISVDFAQGYATFSQVRLCSLVTKITTKLGYLGRLFPLEFHSFQPTSDLDIVILKLFYGVARLTEAGEQLLKICTPKPLEGFEAYLKTELAKQQITLILEPTE